MWEIFKKEIKNGIFNSPIKIIRFFGILLVPFLYGFIYIFAFFSPLDKTNKLDFVLLVSSINKDDPFVSDISSHFSKNKKDLVINVNTIYMESKHIIDKDQVYQDEISKHYSTVVINPVFQKNSNGVNKEIRITDRIAATFPKGTSTLSVVDLAKKFYDLILNTSTKNQHIADIYINYKKSFLIGFGANVKSSTIKSLEKVIGSLFTVKPNELAKAISNKTGIDENMLLKAWETISHNYGVNATNTLFLNKAQMHEHAEYGFGLSPFFVSLALWVGSLTISLFIHGKIYDPKVSKIKAYFAKLFIFWIGNIVQVLILFASLAIIGFSALGSNFGYMFVIALLTSFVFSIIVHSIRLMIPNRVVGIILVVFILILQMGASGGLFPLLTQSNFYQVVHYIIPMTYSVAALREGMFQSDAIEIFKNLSILITFAVPFVIVSPIIYSIRKNKESKSPAREVK